VAGEVRRGGYVWEPFREGNEVAVTHGARSPQKLAPLAAEIEMRARALPDWPPHLAGSTRYDSEVAAWAWAEATCSRLRDYLAEQDPVEMLSEHIDVEENEEQVSQTRRRRVSHTRRTTAALEMLRRWEATAGNRREKLGLTPVTAARLARDLMAARQSAGPSVSALWSEMEEQDE
jgi:hypothetical protein